MRISRILPALTAAMAMLLSGCIHNDIPYPSIHANFLTFEVDGASQPSRIDSTNYTVTVYLAEPTDIRKVTVKSYSLTPETRMSGIDLSLPLNLEQPETAVLSIYQDYTWTISAVQNIDRYFTVKSQIGTSVIDTDNHTVTATIPTTADLSRVTVLTMKLGAEGSTVSDDLAGKTVDFSSPVKVTVTTHGIAREWTITIDQTDAPVTSVRADAWTCVAWLYGEAQEGKDNGFEYRRASETSWQKVPAEWITAEGGNFRARLIHLEPSTDYVARAYSGSDFGEEMEFTTGMSLQVPNSDFNSWWLNGKIWNPWAENSDRFWDTGNKGATTLGPSNTVPTDDTPTGTGQAAKLETRFVGVSILGKLAAGNIFTGEYVATEGTNGILSFGREFKQRPTKLRGYFKYNSVPISHATTQWNHLKGQPDTCIVWVALSDGEQPYEIRTNPKKLQLFDKNDPSVIAYGNFELGETVTEYMPFEVNLDYNATNRVPNYIVIVGSASKYGDYFTGGNGSVLWLDDLELVYDY